MALRTEEEIETPVGNFHGSSNEGELVRRTVWGHGGFVRRIFLGIIAAAAGFFPAASVCAEEASPKPAAAKVVIIPVREQIAKPELYILRRGLKEAIEQKVDTIILDMETPGGRLDVTFDMLKALEKFPGKTVTYINREAISAGALISAGTDEIYFAPGSVIGAAAPVNADGGDIDATMRGKIVSYLKARVRSISEGKGHRGEVISAMIDMESELKIGEEIIKKKGELLSLTGQEAVKTYGDPAVPLLGLGIADNIDTLMDQLHGAGNYSVQRLEVTWSEKLAQYLTSITPVLLGLGMLLLFIEFKTPGFGFFGVAGLSLMAIVFFGQFAAGLSGHEPILFFLLGAALIALEVFLFPGLLVPAITGAVLMLVSLVWAMTDLWPGQPIQVSGDILFRPLANLMTGTALAIVLFLALLKFLPRGGLWGNMVLTAEVAGEPFTRSLDGGSAHSDARSLVGESGIAVTALFPSGQVEVDGKRYEARVAIGHADAGTPVRVTGISEFGLSVEVLT